MKRILTWALPASLVLTAQLNANAQSTVQVQASQTRHRLEGAILDSVTRQPLAYTTVALFAENNPTPITGNTANEKGLFKLEGLPTGVYRLVIESMGYARKTLGQVTIPAQSTQVNLGTILVAPAVHQLTEVTVTGQAPVYENKIDRLIYNPEREVTGANGDAAELLRKVPMLSVDMDGNVALRGNKSVRILIDGKPSGAMSGNVGDILQSIPAAQVKNIEVITSPSARYDAEGSGGIINIITHKSKLDGINGSVNAGIGTRQLNSNASLSGRVGRLSIDINAGINNKWPRLVESDFYSYDEIGNTSSTKGTTLNTRLSNNISSSLQYDFDGNNSISSTFRRTGLGYTDKINTRSANNSIGRNLVKYTLNSESQFNINGFDWSTDYLHRFKKEGHQLSIAFQWSQNTSARNYLNFYSNYFTDQQAKNTGRNNEYTVQGDYILPVNNKIRLETGAKSILRPITSQYNYFLIDSLGSIAHDINNSNIFNYNQQVYAAYLVLQISLPKEWTMHVGNRIEFTHIMGSSENTSLGLISYINAYKNSLPSIILSKKLKNDNTLQLNYNERIQRPSLQFLNPFRNTNDPLNQLQGTPQLAPERLRTIEFAYNAVIKAVNINAAFYYKKTDDIIESFVETIPYTTTTDVGSGGATRNISLTRYGNIGSNSSLGFNFFSSVNLNKVFSIRGSFNIYTYHPQVIAEYNTFLNPGTFFQCNGFASIICKLPKDLSLESLYSFQSRERTFQGTTANLNILNLGVKKLILSQKASVGITIVNLFRNNWDFIDYINTKTLTRYSNFSTPFRSFNFNLSYKFGSNQTKSSIKRGVTNDDLKEKSN